MSDKSNVVLMDPADAVMQIEYQMPLSPNGQGIGFRVPVSVGISAAALKEVMDRVSNEARRLSYVEELPRTKHLLRAKEAAVEHMAKERAAALARQELHQMEEARRHPNRRNEMPARPADISAVAQFDAKIAETLTEIDIIKRRIPYLEGFLAGTCTALDDPAGSPMSEAAD